MESDNGYKATFDYFTASDDIEMAEADGQWIAVVHTDDRPSLTITVDIDSHGRTVYLIYDTLIIKVVADPNHSDRRVFCVMDVGMFSYLSLVSMMLSVGISAENMTTIPGERAMVVVGDAYYSSGSTFFVSAQDLPWMSDGSTSLHQIRAYIRAKFDMLNLYVADFICLCSNSSTICWAGNAKVPATEFSLSLIRWAPTNPRALAEILDDVVNERILLKDLVCVHATFRAFHADYFTENQVASFANDGLWPNARPVLRARYQRFRDISYGDYIQIVADEVKRRAHEAEEDAAFAEGFNRLLGGTYSPGHGRGLGGTYSPGHGRGPDGPHSDTGPSPGITRETLREAIRMMEPNRGGDGFTRRNVTGEDRGYRSTSPPVEDEVDTSMFGGDPLNPERNNGTDPISFGAGESASHEVGETPDGPGLASPQQSGIDPNCERSMMIAPPA